MHWITSPLTATAVVCATLAALAIPLRKLTSDRADVAMALSATSVASDHGHHNFPVRIHLRLLADVESIRVSALDGTVLWQAEDLEAGEHDHDVRLHLHDHQVELLVDANFGDLDGETAFFITLVPEGLDEQTRHAIGSGQIEELLDFGWNIQR
jgi:hypothetical protein